MNNRPRIFIIEDVPEMASLIAMYIEKADMQAFSYSTAEAALSEMKTTGEPDCLILDLNLPGMSGFDFLTRIRRDFRPTVPVVIVSARDADEDVIKGLGIGADEFVTKPFSPRVLVARIQAHLRRMTVSSAAAEESVRFGDYVLLLDSNVLKNGGRKIQLSVKEYAVLEYLIQNAGTSLSPEKIYTKVWKTQFGDMTAVAVYIQRLRKKIEKDPSNPMFIKTDFGNGYFFPKEAIIA
ncbi:MAG: response regulator transcription factor [Treponema porcinum]|uniref:Two-component system, OmpR family, response regulator RegX3 n=3 Tax=Treponema porcinum TaxID=261392 RepID=A0A1T4M6Q9_TREPO|nr:MULTISPECIES: response regulator transcription factor [Treponema]MCI6481601.1 response regulator transcription factor [Treponema porcinum]MCI7534331.1 response regulator transcription factor [Treponema porcinum]MCI7546208.1 response regulator transcription factor [Treponema porcinum]MDD6898916.1 response regulator transcription factor [Treponema porcinum]MDD7125799.1 response regulator transcription factor [Treponema porcinum]